MKRWLILSSLILTGTVAAQDDFLNDIVAAEQEDMFQEVKKAAPKEINFKKMKVAEENKPPYLAVFHFPGMIPENTRFKIRFYVSDYDQNEWRGDGKQREFTVTFKINGKTYTKHVKSGDDSMESDPLPPGRHDFSVQATDAQGRKSPVLNFETASGKMTIDASETYKITEADLKKYNINHHGDYGKLVLLKTGLPVAKKTARILLFDKPVNDMCEAAAKKAVEMAKNMPVPEKGYVIYAADNDEDGEIDFRQTSSYKGVTVKYAANYDKAAVEKEAVATSEGLTKLFADLRGKGIRKAILLPGTYRTSATKTVIVPSDFTLDLNGATIKMNEYLCESAMILKTADGFNTHVINGIIEGDYLEHDFKNSPGSSEWVCGIAFGKCTYNTFRDLKVRYITGYGVCTGGGFIGPQSFGHVGNLKSVDIDRTTGEEKPDQDRMTSSFLSLEKLKKANLNKFKVSRYLGYQGMSGVNGHLICHFYDADKKYISSEDAYQYRWVIAPEKAEFVRVTLMTPEELDDLTLNTHFQCTNCEMNHLKVEFVRCVGICPSGFSNLLIDKCEIRRSGENLARCGLDAEDGWDGQQNLLIRDTVFHDNYSTDFLICAGHTICVQNLTADNCSLNGRAGGQFVDDCKLGSAGFDLRGKVQSEASRIRNVTGGKYGFRSVKNGGVLNDYSVVIRDCTINGPISGGTFENCKWVDAQNNGEKSEKPKLRNCTVSNVKMTISEPDIAKTPVADSELNCTKGTIQDLDVKNSKLSFDSTIVKNVTLKDCTVTCSKAQIENVKFAKCEVTAAGGDKLIFKDCEFSEDCTISGRGQSTVVFDSCTFKKGCKINNGSQDFYKMIFMEKCRVTTPSSGLFTNARDARLNLRKTRFPQK